MMQCVAAGHSIVALANLRPAHTGEEDVLLVFRYVLQGPAGLYGSARCTFADQETVK